MIFLKSPLHLSCLLYLIFPVLYFCSTALANGTTPSDCPTGKEWVIRESVQLNPACVYRTTLHIATSNVQVDCQGARIEPAKRQYGLLIGGRTKGINMVTVRNCRITGGGNGVFIGLTEPDMDKTRRHDRTALYRLTPHDITLEKLSVEDSRGVGIYVDDYVSKLRILGSRVSGAGSSGIYLEHSTREIEISDSVISGNGFGSFPLPRFGEARREGLSIDSSAHNRVVGNRFEANAAGGVFLYKNCQEHIHTKSFSVPRWQWSEHNLIQGNTFREEKVGVWLASRQSRDLSSWDCGDPPYYKDSHYPDYARNNLVSGNRFEKVGTGVRVEDDDNRIIGNTFSDTDVDIEMGAELRRQVTGKALSGIEMRDNRVMPGSQ